MFSIITKNWGLCFGNINWKFRDTWDANNKGNFRDKGAIVEFPPIGGKSCL